MSHVDFNKGNVRKYPRHLVQFMKLTFPMSHFLYLLTRVTVTQYDIKGPISKMYKHCLHVPKWDRAGLMLKLKLEDTIHL